MMQVLDLFSGIGGFSLGLERTGGFRTVAFCEIDPFCRKVLEKHWPGVPIFEDVRKLTAGDLNDRIDVICGGFPCQPFSCAGKKRGTKDERWLWPEFYRIVCEVKPRWALVENVPGLLSVDSGRAFAGILSDLAQIGYDAEWNVLSASQFGLPHLRKRVFLVAYPHSFGSDEVSIFQRDLPKVNNAPPIVVDIYIENIKRSFPEIPINIRSDDELPSGMDGCKMSNGFYAGPKNIIQNSIEALGNAIVPQCAEYIGNCVLKSEYTMQNCVEEAEW